MMALETHASQAWGAKRAAEVGLHAQRALLVAATFVLPAAIAWLFAESILVAIGQDAEVAGLAGRFLRRMLPVLPVQAGFETAKRFLFAQGVMCVAAPHHPRLTHSACMHSPPRLCTLFSL